ncbi:hypothetical protein H6G00_04670 [Leptolyngbya sp. FACHB-541]|uniref:hypothetical protein n=1 Tax=Leptolyngbya sp. FACHB-541 TaxID=2692810 RepID=UPI001688AB68|nr:hypothetical protein [Leptolyngbya sp. FACHB-541]MBD1995919.1 hypothetical protein [Leptolyngbya sp. FACHB-541]
MNKADSLLGIQTYDQGNIRIDLELSIYQQLQKQFVNFAEFIQKLTDFITVLEHNQERYNINPYQEKFNRGIHILGNHGSELSELDVFPRSHLALKCSEGRWDAEDPRKQFFRSVELAWEFQTKLTDQERALLQICPAYLHFQTRTKSARFKRVLFMPHIEGSPLGKTETGFNSEFCQTFKVPSFKEIMQKFRFSLHRLLDPDRKRQLLKIQSAYLFQRLSARGITIPSLNQKNILATSNTNGNQTQYVIIDPIADYCLPISPTYNLLTSCLCKFE